MSFVIDRRIGLRDDESFFAIRREIIEVTGDAAFLDFAIRRFEKPKSFTRANVASEAIKTDVRTFRRFHRTNAAVVRRMHVTDFEARAIARETARPERRQAAFVGQFRERIDLIHELRELLNVRRNRG